MARNPIPTQLDQRFALADDMIDGIQSDGDIGIVQNNEEVMGTALGNARDANDGYQTKRQLRIAATSAQTTADSNAKAFIGKAKRQLINSLGEQWSTAWAPVGYVNGSLAMPGTLAERYELLTTMKSYFTANPGKANAESGVTAAAATVLHTAFSNARSALHTATLNVKTAFNERDTSTRELSKRMRGLIDEIATLVSDDDPVWYAFGLNAPGDPETPGIPAAPELGPGAAGSGTLLADWADTRRSERYRVWLKLPGEDDFTAIATVTESEAILTGQPLGTLLEIRITAANDAGESLPGASATITLS